MFAVAALIVAMPVTVWSWIGDLSWFDPCGSCLDRLVEHVHISRSTEIGLGIGATSLLIGAIVVLNSEKRAGRIDSRWWVAIGMFSIAGVLVGFGYRVATARVDGVNIGGGMILLLVGPVVILLLLGASILSVVLSFLGHSSNERALGTTTSS